MPIIDTIIGSIFFYPDDHTGISYLNLLQLFKWDFYRGIAMVFINTASVEIDFSILEWRKDEYHLQLIDLLLEGIMQSKQYELLKSLVWYHFDVRFMM